MKLKNAEGPPIIRQLRWRNLFVSFEWRDSAIHIHQVRDSNMCKVRLSREDTIAAQRDLAAFMEEMK